MLDLLLAHQIYLDRVTKYNGKTFSSKERHVELL